MTVEARELDELKKILNETILKVELSRKDIRDIQKFHDRIESFIDDFQESISRIDKILEIQEVVSSNTEQTFDKKSQELMRLMDNLRDEYQRTFDTAKETTEKNLTKSLAPLSDYEQRLRQVEKFQWKWAGIVLGISIVATILLQKIPNPFSLIGS